MSRLLNLLTLLISGILFQQALLAVLIIELDFALAVWEVHGKRIGEFYAYGADIFRIFTKHKCRESVSVTVTAGHPDKVKPAFALKAEFTAALL